jgi:NAD(P)H dehydrogenase (quinone)
MLYFVGMDVLPPFIAWSASWVPDEMKKAYLDQYRERVLALDSTEPIFFHPLSDYDESFRLKPEARR